MDEEGSNYQAGVKTITINNMEIQVYCNDDGYTTIQSRGQFGNPIDYFYRDFNDYLNPFGTAGEEFWLGLENLFYITNQKSYSLKVNVEDANGIRDEATWNVFRIADNEFFTLEVSGYNGGLGGNNLELEHNGRKFTTRDVDNDDFISINCAVLFTSAWWFGDCGGTDYNGQNFNSPNAPAFQGIVNEDFRGFAHSLRSVRMSIKAE